jgi:hypothetical protein
MSEVYRPLTLEEKLPEIFTYHSPTGNQPQMYQALREKALQLAQLDDSQCSYCPKETHQ